MKIRKHRYYGPIVNHHNEAVYSQVRDKKTYNRLDGPYNTAFNDFHVTGEVHVYNENEAYAHIYKQMRAYAEDSLGKKKLWL
jgi:hypothetical protein